MNEVSSIFIDLGAWNWLILAGFLLALELLAPGIFLIWLGIAAAVVGGIAFLFDIGWQAQLILFAVLSLGTVLIARRLVPRDGGETERPLLGRRAEQHVGRSYVVAEAIVNGRGKLRIGDTLWLAEGPDMKEGASAKVTRADGARLIVEPE